jgi:RNA polymerase sigma-70 factor (ECF subfamily)
LKSSIPKEAALKLVKDDASEHTTIRTNEIGQELDTDARAQTHDEDVGETSEQDLIERVKLQDKAAFKQLYDMHMPRVYALCCRLCADRSQAEDATQEVFIQLWRKIDNFKGDSKFSTWLHSVASNITVSYIRKQRGWWQKMFNIEDSNVNERVAEASFTDTDFEKLVYRLPERARMVFVLHAIEGYRHEQVADMLDMAVGTSKAQFHRARQLIEEWIDE